MNTSSIISSDVDLRQAFELQSLAEDVAGAGFWSMDIASGREYCSPGLYRLLELRSQDGPVRIGDWQGVLDAVESEPIDRLIQRSIKDRAAFRAVYRTVRLNHDVRWIEVHGRANHDASGHPLRVTCYFIDVSARRQEEEEYWNVRERQGFLLKLSDALAPLSDPVQIQEEACRVLGQHLKVNRVFYAEVDETGFNRAGPQYVDGVPPSAVEWHTRDFDPSIIARYKRGEMQACDDVTQRADLNAAQKAAYIKEQVVAWAAAPVVKLGMPLGRLMVHQNRPRKWNRSEIDLIKETAERVWPAVQRAKSQAALELTEHIPVGTYIMVLAPGSSAATFSFLSERFLEIIGRDADEVRGNPLQAFACVHPDDRDRWNTRYSEAIANRMPFAGETRVVVRGETRWIKADSITRDMPDGSMIWEGVLIDITDQRQAEEALQHSESRYRLVAEITKEAWWDEDLDTRSATYSPRFLEMLGLGKDVVEFPIESLRELIHPDDLGQTMREFDLAVASDTIFNSIYRLRHADGHYLWVEDQARVVERDAEGRPKRMLGALTDITSRRKAEIALQESEENFRRLFDDAPDAYVIMDQEDLRILAVNHAAIRMLRGSRECIVGIRPSQFSPPHQPNGRPTDAVAAESMRKTLERGYHRFELVHRRFDGTDFWVEVTAGVGNFRQHPVFFLSWREIGEIIAAKQAAEAASIAKSQFLSVMSHELRTPLSAILGLFQLIEMNAASDRIREFTAKGLSNSEHLLGLINDILDLSSLEAGSLAVVKAPFRLKSVTEDVGQMTQAKRKAGVDLQIRLDESLQDLECVSDVLRLRQVLINLVGNALKFTENGTVALTVNRVGGTAEVPLLEFAVSDTGIGMTVEQQSRLFKPFSQVDMSSVRRFGGTGLGLVISQRLVNLLGGGSIAVDSREGAGSRFSFRLPLPASATASLQRPSSVQASTSAVGQLAGYRLLLVEDNETIRLMMRLLLESEGASVEEAEDGEAGVAAALGSSLPFDAVLMDMLMPNKDGLEATRELRARGYVRPIIALTANAYASDRESCLAAGMNDYVSKPVKIGELVLLLQRTCRTAA